jgi:hypothetical protein
MPDLWIVKLKASYCQPQNDPRNITREDILVGPPSGPTGGVVIVPPPISDHLARNFFS